MKKETIYLLLFWAVIAFVAWQVIKLIREYNGAIAASKDETPIK